MGPKLLLVSIAAMMAAFLSTTPGTEAGGGGCHGGFSDAAGNAVDMVGACFEPTVLRVEVGQTVTFSNSDGMLHTVTGAASSWGDYDELTQGDSVSYAFDEAGVYPYFCVFHPGMVAAIVVGGGKSAAAGGQAPRAVSAVVPGGEGELAASEATAADSDSDLSTYVVVAAVAGVAGALAVGGALAVRRRLRRAYSPSRTNESTANSK